MIITEQKPFADILDMLKPFGKIFLVGCGECATTCKTGGEPEVLKLKADLEAAGKNVTGWCIPSAPCIAAQIKTEFSKQMKPLREAEAIMVLSCGLGVQLAKDNDRLGKAVFPACNTLFGAVLDAQGNFQEKCSFCGDCVLGVTAGICPVTLCSKGLLNGPCGGMNKGKCEVDKEKDCAWVLIYKEMEKRHALSGYARYSQPKDYKKTVKPHSLLMTKEA
jgi:ferredoxin